MAHLIDKDALVAEIKRRLKFVEIRLKRNNSYTEDGNTAWKRDKTLYDAYTFLLSFLDTLEVKEVDLDKEIDKFYGMYRKDGQTFSLEDNQECLDWKVDCNPDFEIAFAKHFYELGMCAVNPLTVKDIKKIYHLVNEVSDDLGVRAMYVNIYQEVLKRFKERKEK